MDRWILHPLCNEFFFIIITITLTTLYYRLTVTNADNVYGSDVVNNVLTKSIGKDGVTSVDMLLAPLDSRNFAETGNNKYDDDDDDRDDDDRDDDE